MKGFFLRAVVIAGVLAIVLPIPSKLTFAYEVKDTSAEIRNDFVLEPAKIELSLEPGSTVTKTVSVVNRTDREMKFNLQVEDFTGTKDPNQVVVLLGQQRGPYSLKDFIKPEAKTFTLKPKQRVIMPVVISLPEDAEPGGLYGSLLVSNDPTLEDSDAEGAQGRTKTISRLGALFFVRIEGNAHEEGRLEDFRLTGSNKMFYEKGPFNFELLFSNNGNVHLVPHGNIQVTNLLGRKVSEIGIEPFFVLPDSLRSTEIKWDPGFLLGRYKLTSNITRGYKNSSDQTDAMSLVIWVIPWKVLVGALIALILLVGILKFLGSRFEIKRK